MTAAAATVPPSPLPEDRRVLLSRLVDGLDEAPAPLTGEVPFGLPAVLPPGVVIVATTRPGHPLPPRSRVSRIDVTGGANLKDLEEYIVTLVRRDHSLTERLAARLERYRRLG